MLTSGIQVGWGSQWETLANAINDYYGGGVESLQYQQVVQMLNSGNYTMEEMESIIGNIPEFTRTYNSAGQLTGVSYNVSSSAATSAAGSVAQQINSNVANATKTEFSTVQTITKDAQTGKVAMSDSLVKYKTGQLAPTTAKAVPISALQGVMAASVGITIGKTISQAAYDNGFNWLSWAGVDMESLNPAAWASITQGDDSLGAKAFNMILGLDDNNNPQMYMSDAAFAYMAAYMGAVGVFDGGQPTSEVNNELLNKPTYYNQPIKFIRLPVMLSYTDAYGTHEELFTGAGVMCLTKTSDSQQYYRTFIADNQNDIWYKRYDNGTLIIDRVLELDSITSAVSGLTAYSTSSALSNRQPYIDNFGSFINNLNATLAEMLDYNPLVWQDLVTFYRYKEDTGIDGITDQTGATQFDGSGISDWSDISSVLAALMLQFPELWENRIEVSPDGDTTINYIPVGFPTGGLNQQPTTDGATQSDLAPDITGDGANSTDELIKTLIDAITHPFEKSGMENDTNTPTKPIDPNGDPRGTGATPTIIPPVGSASALWRIYNPSQSQLDTFGAWLWSSNFVDQLLKLFNDPMQAIIGLHKIYATPPVSGSGAIKVGYLVSDANANYVSAQYTEIDCGTVNLKEYFNNVFDYDPFTKISIFLPFIGFRQLNVSDVMRGDISVKYSIDVLTGACLAKISVKRDLNDNVLYTFSGNCAVQYPVSSGSYVGIVTGLLGIVGGIAGTIASGGALAPMLMGAGASVGAMHATVEHSGNISSNAGAMGAKKPYIVIERPQTKLPLYGLEIEGKPQNETITLGSITGHIRVKAAEFNGFNCTANELTKIKQMLESGIVI